MEIGRAWLMTAKLARKAGHSQTAYSAMLQAQHCHASYSFIQGCKLIKANGESLRALQELENALQAMPEQVPVKDGNHADEQMRAKVRARRPRVLNLTTNSRRLWLYALAGCTKPIVSTTMQCHANFCKRLILLKSTWDNNS